MYRLTEWSMPPARLLSGGRRVRLDGYRAQPANTVEVIGLGRSRILLLVVPPNTDPDLAHETMMSAAAPHNNSSVDYLLDINANDREIRDRTNTTEQRWMAGAASAGW